MYLSLPKTEQRQANESSSGSYLLRSDGVSVIDDARSNSDSTLEWHLKKMSRAYD
jgi:hypothetical protein